MIQNDIRCINIGKIQDIRRLRDRLESKLNSEELCRQFDFSDMNIELHIKEDPENLGTAEWGIIRIDGDSYWWKNEIGLWGDQIGKEGCPSISDPNYPNYREECHLNHKDKHNILKIRNDIGLGTRYVFPKLKIKEY